MTILVECYLSSGAPAPDTSTASSRYYATHFFGWPVKKLEGRDPTSDAAEFLSKADAYRRLREISGESYPMESVEEWERWVRQARRSGKRFFTNKNKNL